MPDPAGAGRAGEAPPNPTPAPLPAASPTEPGWKVALKLGLIGAALGGLILAAYGNSFHTGLVLDNSVIISQRSAHHRGER